MDEKTLKWVAEVYAYKGWEPDAYGYCGVTKGWVITSQVPEGFWDKCKADALPLRTTLTLGFLPTPAILEYRRWRKRYGKDIMVVLIPANDMCQGYSMGPILLADLERDPKELLNEAYSLIIAEDPDLSSMKIRTAMLLLGWAETR